MIRFLLFGTPELHNGGGTKLHSVLAHSKQTALLAYLAVDRDGPQRRDRLTSLFWPDLDDVRARNALSKAVHHLRRALGEDIFVAEGNESLALNRNALWSDVAGFETAIAAHDYRSALDLWRRGDLLEAFNLPDCAEFDQWLGQQRLRLRQMAAAAATALAEEAERGMDLSGAADWARLACDIMPYDEKTFQRLLLLLDRAGNRAAALSSFQSFTARIARDLDAVPSQATQSLVESMRNGANGNGVAAQILNGNGVAVHTPPADPPTPPSISLKPIFRRVTIAAALAAMAVAGFWSYRARVSEHPQLVAVGLLRNQTGNRELNPLADIATGGIVQQLSQSGQIDVVDLRSVGTRNDQRQDSAASSGAQASKLAREAGAAKVVTGAMYRRGDSLLVQMQVLSANDGRVIQQLDPLVTPITNSYLLLDRIREGVGGAVAALADTLYLPWSTAHSRPPNYAAFQEFMEGLDAVVHEGVEPAVLHLKKAVALDTGFVEAKIWLLEQASMVGSERRYVDSLIVAATAQRDRLGAFDQLSLDRELAFLAGNWPAVYGAARRLVAIAPSTPDAQVYLAQASMATRRYSEAISVLHGIDPTKGWMKDLSQLWQWDLQAHRLNGDAAGGLAEWRGLRARLPNDYGACAAGVPLLATLGREQDVNALVSECARIKGAPARTDRPLEIAGKNYLRAGHPAAARRAFERALAIRTSAAGADHRRVAGVAILDCELGRWRQAYEALETSTDTADLDFQTLLGVVAAHVGDTATVKKALRHIDQWNLREPPQGQDKMARAFIALAGGDRREALSRLKEAMNEGVAPAWNGWYLRFELEPLRGDPQFEEMIAPRS